MKDLTEIDILKGLIENTYYVTVNMNDVFGWGCADCEELDGDDLLDLVPYLKKYGWVALYSLVSIKREIYEDYISEPQPALKCHNFQEVRKELYDDMVKEKGDLFWEINHKREEVEKEISIYGERVKYTGTTKKSGLIPQVQYLEKAGIYAIGSNTVSVEKELKRKFLEKQNEEI